MSALPPHALALFSVSRTGMETARAPEVADIEAARQRLAGRSVITPLLRSDLLDRALGIRLLVKAECLQRTGSFKFRGAYNRLCLLDAAARAAGVIAFSSGNHAQGVALAAELLGVPATIVMPSDAPAIKLGKTRAYGARVVTYDRQTQDREAVAAHLLRRHGGTIVPPFDDPAIIAGQGTATLEAIEQANALGLPFDALIVPAGGGGLVAGAALACSGHAPATAVFAAEPDGFDDHARSLAAGERLANRPDARSICDALQAPQPGALTFEVNRRLLAGGLTVSEGEIGAAMRAAFRHFRLVVEPGGAVALAAALAGKLPRNFATVAVIVSGGNVDPALYAQILAG